MIDLQRQGTDNNENKAVSSESISISELPSTSKLRQFNSSLVLPVFSLIESDYQENEKESRASPFSRLTSSAAFILSSVGEKLQSRSAANGTIIEDEEYIDSVESKYPPNGTSIQPQFNSSNESIQERQNEGKTHFLCHRILGIFLRYV